MIRRLTKDKGAVRRSSLLKFAGESKSTRLASSWVNGFKILNREPKVNLDIIGSVGNIGRFVM
jgi:hypothetical protein